MLIRSFYLFSFKNRTLYSVISLFTKGFYYKPLFTFNLYLCQANKNRFFVFFNSQADLEIGRIYYLETKKKILFLHGLFMMIAKTLQMVITLECNPSIQLLFLDLALFMTSIVQGYQNHQHQKPLVE